MITLYGIGPGFGLPEISPYVTKTEVQLKMAGLDYRKVKGRAELSPKGQLPFIEDDGELVADSTFIRAHIEARYGVDLDAGLSRVERAETALRAALTGAGLPVRDLRVRDLGDRAKVEIDAALVDDLLARPELLGVVEGFETVEVDPRGFRSGSMNEALADIGANNRSAR